MKKIIIASALATLILTCTIPVSAATIASSSEIDIPSEESTAIGYTVIDSNNVTHSYLNGQLKRQNGIQLKSVSSTYNGYTVTHDSGKDYDWSSTYPYSGWSSTSMVKGTSTYIRHYTRVMIDNGKGQTADSERQWTNGATAYANTVGIKSSSFDTLRSYWGTEE